MGRYSAMTDKEVLDRFGVTEEQLDQWEEDATNGIFHGSLAER